MGAIAVLLPGCSTATGPTKPPISLWVSSSTAGRVVGYTASQLTATDSVAPAAVVRTLGSGNGAIAINARGHLWVASFTSGTVSEYDPNRSAADSLPVPLATLTTDALGSLNGPFGLVFDSQGSLWVANTGLGGAGAGTLVKFTADQLAASGNPHASVTLTLPTREINVPQALAFDHAGNLWVTLNGAVKEFSPDQLAASGTPVPIVSITPQGDDPYLGSTVAFGRAGGLWVIGLYDRVLKFEASQLEATGFPAPAVTLILSGASGLAFDNAGDLWTTNPLGVLTEYTPGQITASGTPAPAVRIAATELAGAYQLMFVQ